MGLSTPEVLLGGRVSGTLRKLLIPSCSSLLKIPVLKFLLHSASYLWFSSSWRVPGHGDAAEYLPRHGEASGRLLYHMVWVAEPAWVGLCCRQTPPPGDPSHLYSEAPLRGGPYGCSLVYMNYAGL